jgi:hypothetical protein
MSSEITNNIFFGLQFSALIFFNLCCIFGFILIVLGIRGMLRITDKTSDALDAIKDSAEVIGDTVIDLSDAIAPFILPKKFNWFSFLMKLLGRK